MSESKLDQLRDLFRSFGSCVVAYSGGVDSVLLARVGYEVLGDRSLAAIADSPSLPRRELEEALTLAQQAGFPVKVLKTKEFNNPDYLANPANRCYFCKFELFTELEPLARQEGYQVLVYGENASDLGDYRPGSQAASEFQVRAPLREVGLTKDEIRACSAQLGLPTAGKPQMACLSSRIPYGERVTVEKLAMVEAAENLLRDLGFHDVRVRHHELGSGWPGGPLTQGQGNGGAPHSPAARHLARIELGKAELARFLASDARDKISDQFKEIGYAFATVDLQGYRRGSLNEGLPAQPTGK